MENNIITQKLDLSIESRNEHRLEKTYSLSSFINGTMMMEALVNCLYSEFHKRKPIEIPVAYFANPKHNKNLIKKAFENWSLINKLYYIVPLCYSKLIDPSHIFDVQSDKWKTLSEIIEYRNETVHAYPNEIEISVVEKYESHTDISDSNENNFFSLTKFPKDIRSFNYECAKKSYDNVNWVTEMILSKLNDELQTIKFIKEEVWNL